MKCGLAAAFIIFAASSAASDAGFVVTQKCSWSADGKSQLQSGATVAAGSHVRLLQRSNGPCEIVIALYDDTVRTRDCASGAKCEELVVPATIGSPEPAIQRIFAAIADLFVEHHERYAVPIIRGQFVRDTVIRVTADRIDLTSLLDGLVRRPSVIRLRNTDGAVIDCEVGPDPTAPCHVTPGVYDISLLQHEQIGQPAIIGTARILVLHEGAEFDRKREAFDSAVAKLASLDLADGARQQLLRAYLDHLARSAP